MPALKKVAPIILKEILEAGEWTVYNEDKLNWSLVNDAGESVEIPKVGRSVSFQVMENALAKAELAHGEYFRLLGIVEEARRLRNLPVDGSEKRPSIN